ncbi:hypothetical protein B0T10DRAFT_577079 [Thelonectria olida]|uniref:Uncharacterized protein n=1 Tax=Thelonectria olida TaxID=1576542 RepID=A0A9P8VZE7_9HYPO|nr:hypothetical protein B0T10DRAFT_577079 [Thelonectria olida]
MVNAALPWRVSSISSPMLLADTPRDTPRDTSETDQAGWDIPEASYLTSVEAHGFSGKETRRDCHSMFLFGLSLDTRCLVGMFPSLSTRVSKASSICNHVWRIALIIGNTIRVSSFLSTAEVSQSGPTTFHQQGRMLFVLSEDSASLELPDEEHRQLLEQAVKNILYIDVTEFTYAQILDGLPTEKSVRDSFSWPKDHPALTASHEELCPGFIDKARKFRAELHSSQLRFQSQPLLAFQDESVDSRAFHSGAVRLSGQFPFGEIRPEGRMSSSHTRDAIKPSPVASLSCLRVLPHLSQQVRKENLTNATSAWLRAKCHRLA